MTPRIFQAFKSIRAGESDLPSDLNLDNKMSHFWSPLVFRLSPYVPGEQPKIANLVKLNTNEHPYGPSPKVLEAIRAEVGDNLRLYPDPDASALKKAIAAYHGLQTKQVFVGNGSDEVLAFIFQALFQHEQPLLFPDVTYSFYPVYCGLYEIDYQMVPLADDFSIRIADYLRPNGGIIFPNPNAPTGRALALGEIEKLLKANTDSVVVVDEAYVDFGGESAISLVNRYPNLLVTQTLSKSRSLAGLRVGFAVGHSDLIEALIRVKDSFNSYPLDRLAIVGAAASFGDEAYFQQSRQAVIDSREVLVNEMSALGFEAIPSAANFIFTRHPAHDAARIAAGLREHGVIVRHFNKPRIEQYLRITIGTPQQNQALIDALQHVLAA
jgi:histidinol-phosphate aminotransferase